MASARNRSSSSRSCNRLGVTFEEPGISPFEAAAAAAAAATVDGDADKKSLSDFLNRSAADGVCVIVIVRRPSRAGRGEMEKVEEEGEVAVAGEDRCSWEVAERDGLVGAKMERSRDREIEREGAGG